MERLELTEHEMMMILKSTGDLDDVITPDEREMMDWKEIREMYLNNSDHLDTTLQRMLEIGIDNL